MPILIDPVTLKVDPSNDMLLSAIKPAVVPSDVITLLSPVLVTDAPDNKFVDALAPNDVRSKYPPLAFPPCSKNLILFW